MIDEVPRSPKVFISYSHDSAEHKAQVRALADRLRTDGVDVELDQYEVAPSEGWPQWTRRAIETADTVLVVFTETYQRRYLGEEAEGAGLGVAWEGRILTQTQYNAAGKSLNLIPVSFGLEDTRYIPIEFQGAHRHELGTEAGYEDLFRRLTDQPAIQKPALGPLLRLQPEKPPQSAIEKPPKSPLAEELARAHKLRATLEANDEDTAVVTAEIIDLKRKLREGGQIKTGDILADRFELMESIGRGGFSTVWKSIDLELHQPVAVKVLHSQYAEDRSRRKRFFRGARKMYALHHAGIVRVLERRLEDQGFHFFVMEYVHGMDLRRAVLEKKLSFQESLEVILAVGEALSHAHENGLVHRDIKPANILLGRENHPKLTDFDLVRAADSTGGTRTESMFGTFLYAAPETLGQAKEAEEPADVYSLGMTTVFALAAQGELPQIVIRDAPGYIAQLDCHNCFKDVLAKAVAWEAEDRYPSVEAFSDALRIAIASQQPRKGVRKVAEPSHGKRATPLAGKHAPGTEWNHERIGMVFVYVQGGTYTLGRNQFKRRVTLNPFWIGKYPVTHEQYARFLKATARHDRPAYWDDPGLNPVDHPVVGVNWEDARDYCEWAGLALPNEMQWEAAARGTEGRRYPWGEDEPTAERANFGQSLGTGKTTPVTAHPAGAGPYGTLDQAGNVWEWCDDVWNPNASSSRRNARVARGGSWQDPSESLVAAYRDGFRSAARFRFLGFRCVCFVSPEP